MIYSQAQFRFFMILSIITPVYNCESFIEESLNSLCDQDFSFPTELILINDGSEDDTWSIVIDKCLPRLKSSSLKQIKIANDDIRLFLPTRRNQALNISEGSLIAIHDGDDLSLTGRFNKQVPFLMSRPSVFCVGGHAQKIDYSSDPIGDMCYPPELHSRIMLDFYIGKMNPIIDPTTVFRADMIRNIGGYSLAPDKYTIPDFDLWLRAITRGFRFHNLMDFLVTYRLNPDGMTRKHGTVMVDQHKSSMKEYRDGDYKKYNKNNWLKNTLELQYEKIEC